MQGEVLSAREDGNHPALIALYLPIVDFAPRDAVASVTGLQVQALPEYRGQP